jgi:hypothetical protein
MTGKEYVKSLERGSPDFISFDYLVSELAAGKYRAAALRLINDYPEFNRIETLDLAFDWMITERGYFTNKTGDYFKRIVIDIYNQINEEVLS